MHVKLLTISACLAHSASGQAASPIVIDAAGTPVGYLVNQDANGHPDLVSPTGYAFRINSDSGELTDQLVTLEGFITARIFYTNSDCSSPMYVPNIGRSSGFVFKDSDSAVVAYVPKGAAPNNSVALTHVRNGTNCQVSAQVFNGGMPALVNAPSITAVSSTTFIEPLRIEIGEFGDCLLRDGYENCEVQPVNLKSHLLHEE